MVVLLQAGCAHIPGGPDDIELLPQRTDAWRVDYKRIVMNCKLAPKHWVQLSDYPEECSPIPTLELWIRDSIYVDDKNRATLGR